MTRANRYASSQPRTSSRGSVFAAVLALAVIAMALTASAGTKLAFTWRNPAYTGGNFKNILILAVNGKASRRADFEDRMVQIISRPGLTAVQSYSYIPRPDATPIDKTQLREVIQNNHFDGILVACLTKYKKRHTYVSGSYDTLPPTIGSFWGYYEWVTPVVYTPGYMETDTKAQLETNLYSTSTDDAQLAWTGTSTIVDPRSPTSAINDVVKQVVEQLQKQNLI